MYAASPLPLSARAASAPRFPRACRVDSVAGRSPELTWETTRPPSFAWRIVHWFVPVGEWGCALSGVPWLR